MHAFVGIIIIIIQVCNTAWVDQRKPQGYKSDVFLKRDTSNSCNMCTRYVYLSPCYCINFVDMKILLIRLQCYIAHGKSNQN